MFLDKIDITYPSEKKSKIEYPSREKIENIKDQLPSDGKSGTQLNQGKVTWREWECTGEKGMFEIVLS